MENASSQSISTRSVGLRYGLILAIISIIYFLILSLAGINAQEGAWNYLGILFTIAILILAHKYFKENGNGFMSYGEGVGIGFWICLVSSVISTLFSYIYIKFIDASMLDMIREKQLESMEGRGMSDEQIEQAMEMAAKFSTPEMILIFGILMGLFFGMLVVLLVTIFTQKKNPDAVI